jgi:hypothetical protein
MNGDVIITSIIFKKIRSFVGYDEQKKKKDEKWFDFDFL